MRNINFGIIIFVIISLPALSRGDTKRTIQFIEKDDNTGTAYVLSMKDGGSILKSKIDRIDNEDVGLVAWANNNQFVAVAGSYTRYLMMENEITYLLYDLNTKNSDTIKSTSYFYPSWMGSFNDGAYVVIKNNSKTAVYITVNGKFELYKTLNYDCIGEYEFTDVSLSRGGHWLLTEGEYIYDGKKEYYEKDVIWNLDNDSCYIIDGNVGESGRIWASDSTFYYFDSGHYNYYDIRNHIIKGLFDINHAPSITLLLNDEYLVTGEYSDDLETLNWVVVNLLSNYEKTVVDTGNCWSFVGDEKRGELFYINYDGIEKKYKFYLYSIGQKERKLIYKSKNILQSAYIFYE